ncbi:MAG: hypothetical protein H0U71_08015 [Gammaproteobacteria bacterium]|nr:hypothetical protein [Gammaproteobacteria bacterium]
MEKKLLLLSFLFFAVPAQAYTCYDYGRLAIQGSLVTDGNLSIGITHYTEQSEIGVYASGLVNNACCETRIFAPGIFAGFRKNICECTYFAAGIDFVSVFGTENCCHIDADYTVGPYISLEQKLTSHLLLIGWIQPFSYQYEDKCNCTVATNRFFASGGIAMSYLF